MRVLNSRLRTCVLTGVAGRGSIRNPIKMPKLKLKTHKGAAKRFKKTGTGKIMRHHAGARHILTSKSPGRKRKLAAGTPLDDTNMNAIKEMLPY